MGEEHKGTRMINELPTAFPWMHKDLTCTGMTLRDYFAARAMGTLIEGRRSANLNQGSYKAVSIMAYQMADEMIKARGQANG